MSIRIEDAALIDLSDVVTGARIAPSPPGVTLLEDFMKPARVTQYRLAKALGLPITRINAVVLGKRAITAETALLLARFFGTTAEFWLGLQAQYELRRASRRLRARLARVAPLAA